MYIYVYKKIRQAWKILKSLYILRKPRFDKFTKKCEVQGVSQALLTALFFFFACL